MTLPAIKVQGLSKKFIISHETKERYTSLRDVIAKRARSLLKRGRKEHQVQKEEFYALRDVSFDVQPGDRIGIIGRNGAGKSTLLKILSRITEPTSGRVSIHGRVASLLEVGTGFHPELTGRENIFLNGAILGMSRTEIKRKFDEMVAFAEIERFLDTPVKRYSSGMYVRLAFSVAAHLEPEILIVDEVLAVGDAQFQKKCLGKMQDVSKDGGRTVIFVSHNMTAIQSLCNKGLFMNRGQLVLDGDIDACIKEYLENGVRTSTRYQPEPQAGKQPGDVEIEFAELYKNRLGTPAELVMLNDKLLFHIRYKLNKPCELNLSLVLWTQKGDCVFNVCSEAKAYDKGAFESTLVIPADFLNDEMYIIELMFVEDTTRVIHRIPEMIVFEMHEPPRNANYYEKWMGVTRPKLDFKIAEI